MRPESQRLSPEGLSFSLAIVLLTSIIAKLFCYLLEGEDKNVKNKINANLSTLSNKGQLNDASLVMDLELNFYVNTAALLVNQHHLSLSNVQLTHVTDYVGNP